MRITIPVNEQAADEHLPESKPDASGVGVNYAEQILKSFKATLEDGRKVSAKRRGLKITVTIGEKSGEAILRRLDHGPDVKNIFRLGLQEAARNAGSSVTFEVNAIHLDID